MSSRGNVRALYLSVLARPADDGSLNYYAGEWERLVNEYNADPSEKEGGSAEGYAASLIRQAMANSQEGQNRAGVIRNAYQTYLGRPASDQEIQNYVNQSRDTLSLVKEISESQEAFTFKKNLRESYLPSYFDVREFSTNNEETESAGQVITGFVGNQQDLAVLDHWTKYGRNESRMIPAQAILILKDGQIQYSPGAEKLLSTYVKQRYDNLIFGFKNSNGGNYKDLMNQVNELGDPTVRKNFFEQGSRDTLDGYYIQNKIQIWDPVQSGAQPPVGGFDPQYYRSIDTTVNRDWVDAISNKVAYDYTVPDLDITVRYGNIDNFAQQKYTNAVRNNPAIRGNPIVKSESEEYEEILTDADRQRIRDQILGLTDTSESGAPTIDWTNADGDIEADSLLESQVGATFSERELEQQGRFQAVATDALRTAANELKKQSAKEQELALYKSLPGFDEIYNVNSSLANSILGDSGLGGMLALSGKDTDAMGESLEKQIEGITGISSNNSVYNWQKWFDESLTKRYEEMDEIKGFTNADKDKVYQIEQEFKDSFINEYLKPRFDQSKSMSEFISYIDTVDKESEQNIFQTQTALNALRDFANLKARQYYTNAISSTGSGFDSNFYFDPLASASNPSKYIDNEALYTAQTAEVNTDWEEAKNNPNKQVTDTPYTWGQWAYYYGYDLNDKNDFAKLHYAVIGKGKGFDPAENVITDQEAKDFINTSLLPALADEKLNIGDTSFLAFVTPEEFSEAVLEGIDPSENKEEWKKVLETYGFEDDASLEEVKNYIEDAARTGAAKTMRESIKYLNEKKKKPTQKRLGVDYIEREEDNKYLASDEETTFFKIFKDAGYGGTQEEFFDEFMPDIDRGELMSLGKAATGDSELKSFTSSDPFENLGTIGSFFSDDGGLFGSDGESSSSSDDGKDNYFSLFGDEEDDSDYATDTGRSIINDYTSFFK